MILDAVGPIDEEVGPTVQQQTLREEFSPVNQLTSSEVPPVFLVYDKAEPEPIRAPTKRRWNKFFILRLSSAACRLGQLIDWCCTPSLPLPVQTRCSLGSS